MRALRTKRCTSALYTHSHALYTDRDIAQLDEEVLRQLTASLCADVVARSPPFASPASPAEDSFAGSLLCSLARRLSSSSRTTRSTSAVIWNVAIFHHMTKSARKDQSGYLNDAGLFFSKKK